MPFPVHRGLGSSGSNVGVAVGTSVMAASPAAGPAAPIVAAVGALVTLASTIAGALHIGEGCGPTCVQATSIVNQAEQVLAQNQQAYATGQIDRATAVSNFNQIWNAVQQSCSAIPGAAGANCIGDRQRGGKWDWFAMHLDPILSTPDTSTTGTLATELLGGSNSTLLLLGGLVVVGVILASN